MQVRRLCAGFLALFAAACLFAADALGQSVVDRAKELLRQGKPQEAFDLLDPAADQLNDAESAYLLGIAALDTGKAGLAVIAFERSLAYDPNFAPARAELVRALLTTGETDQARLHLQRLAGAPVPPEVREKLTALERRLAEATDLARQQTRGISGYAELEAGYDTNVNTGANSRTIEIPLFGGAVATLDRAFVKKASPVLGIGTGAIAYTELQPGLRGFVGADLKFRGSTEKINEDRYETHYWTSNAGLRWQRGPYTVTGALTYLESSVDDLTYDRQKGFYLQGQMQLDPNNEVGLFGQYMDVQHPIQRTIDSTLRLAGVGWRRGLEGAGSPIFTLSAYYGDDSERGPDPSVGRRLHGARASYERQLEIGARLLTALSVQRSKYKGENIFFFRVREDERLDASIGLAFSPYKNVTVTPQFVYTRNRSNIAPIDFTREQLLITVRRDFY
jgi:hypothetical protein